MDESKTSYKVDDWMDLEHCVYHAITDAPEKLTSHRLAHVIARLAASLVEKEIVTVAEIEEFLATSRR
jgi:hypothetical protein